MAHSVTQHTGENLCLLPWQRGHVQITREIGPSPRPRGLAPTRSSGALEMAVYDPDEVVIPNKLWMGDVSACINLQAEHFQIKYLLH